MSVSVKLEKISIGIQPERTLLRLHSLGGSALEAVLSDIAREEVDQIVVAGDVAAHDDGWRRALSALVIALVAASRPIYLLAPLAGYTNLSFRLAVRGLGGSLATGAGL